MKNDNGEVGAAAAVDGDGDEKDEDGLYLCGKQGVAEDLFCFLYDLYQTAKGMQRPSKPL